MWGDLAASFQPGFGILKKTPSPAGGFSLPSHSQPAPGWTFPAPGIWMFIRGSAVIISWPAAGKMLRSLGREGIWLWVLREALAEGG